MGAPRTTPDLTGQKFGKWTVYEEVEKDGGGKIRYRCQCECGEWSTVRAYELLNGNSQCCRKCASSAHWLALHGRTADEVREYMKEHTTKEGAEHFGLTLGGLQRYMKYHGIPWPKKRYAKPKRSQMVVIEHRKPTPAEVEHARKVFNYPTTPRLRVGINDRSPHEERRWKWSGQDYLARMREYEGKVAK